MASVWWVGVSLRRGTWVTWARPEWPARLPPAAPTAVHDDQRHAAVKHCVLSAGGPAVAWSERGSEAGPRCGTAGRTGALAMQFIGRARATAICMLCGQQTACRQTACGEVRYGTGTGRQASRRPGAAEAGSGWGVEQCAAATGVCRTWRHQAELGPGQVLAVVPRQQLASSQEDPVLLSPVALLGQSGGHQGWLM